MRIVRTANFVAAFISIFLYLSLTITCYYFANKFWDRENNTLRGGRYAMPKFVFFVVLGISSLFELPSFIGCVSHGGPSSCVWNDSSYAFAWCCHLIATCGYSFAIITPSILWSDIVQQKDGNFFNSISPLDSIKIFFRTSFILYCAVILMMIIGVCMYSKSSNEAQYSNSNAVGAIGNCLTPTLLFVITLGCVWSGRSLQSYIRNVQLGTVTQMKIIRKLNTTMILIATTYGMRAMLVLSLFGQMPDAYIDAFKPVRDYPVWLLLTQWLPYLLCSFSLVNSMRFKEEGNKPASGRHSSALAAGLEEGRNSPSKVNKTAALGGSSGSLHHNTSFSIESDPTKSPFDHTHSNDSSAHLSSVDGKTLDYLLTVASENSNKHSYFHHDDDEDDQGTSPAEGGSLDHFFTTSALQARSVLSVVSSTSAATATTSVAHSGIWR